MVSVGGPVTSMAFLPDSLETLSGNRHFGKKEVVYGTGQGQLGQLFFEQGGETGAGAG